MRHIQFFNNFNESANEQSKVDFLKDFIGVKFHSTDVVTNKLVTKLAKEHHMFLLVTHSGVKYFISESAVDVAAFKKAISSL